MARQSCFVQRVGRICVQILEQPIALSWAFLSCCISSKKEYSLWNGISGTGDKKLQGFVLQHLRCTMVQDFPKYFLTSGLSTLRQDRSCNRHFPYSQSIFINQTKQTNRCTWNISDYRKCRMETSSPMKNRWSFKEQSHVVSSLNLMV